MATYLLDEVEKIAQAVVAQEIQLDELNGHLSVMNEKLERLTDALERLAAMAPPEPLVGSIRWIVGTPQQEG